MEARHVTYICLRLSSRKGDWYLEHCISRHYARKHSIGCLGNAKVFSFEVTKITNKREPEIYTSVGPFPKFISLALKAIISGEKDISRVAYDVFKSRVYSLGVCLIYATIFEVPIFITDLDKLPENTDTQLNEITKYSRRWVNMLRQMLTVEEEQRPDFMALNSSFGTFATCASGFMTLNSSLRESLAYGGDEPIQAVAAKHELQNPLKIIVKCGLEYVRVSQTISEEVPCLISLKALEFDLSLTCCSTDIVAVIDISGSMAGSRIDLVKQTLIKFIQLLGPRDRLSIVTFSSYAERKCPLICCSSAGKEILNKITEGLDADGSTNISAGLVMGLEILEQRRTMNAGASILLFSDGQSYEGPDPFSTFLQKYSERRDEKITIHEFGYGDEIDSRLLETLSNKGKGVFYHIREESQIEIAFGLVYANITTVVARNLRVRVTINPGPVRCSVPLFYTKEERDECFTLPDITANQQKDMIFILKPESQSLSKPTLFAPVTVDVQFQDSEGLESTVTANLDVKFVPRNDTVPSRDPQVLINWYRVKSAYCLREARTLANKGKFRDANQRLRNEIKFLQSCGYERHEYIAAIIRDLEEALKMVQDNTTWQRGGDAHFASISYSHISQTASVLTMQYSSAQQLRSVIVMNQMQAPLAKGSPKSTK